MAIPSLSHLVIRSLVNPERLPLQSYYPDERYRERVALLARVLRGVDLDKSSLKNRDISQDKSACVTPSSDRKILSQELRIFNQFNQLLDFKSDVTQLVPTFRYVNTADRFDILEKIFDSTENEEKKRLIFTLMTMFNRVDFIKKQHYFYGCLEEILALAAESNHQDIIKVIIDNLAIIHLPSVDEACEVVMEVAARCGYVRLLHLLVDKASAQTIKTAFKMAVQHKQVRAIIYLQNQQVVASDDPLCREAYLLAAQVGSLEALQKLDWMIKDRETFNSAIKLAAKHGHLHIVQYLKLHRFVVSTFISEAYVEAAKYGHLHIIESLYLVTHKTALRALLEASTAGHARVVCHILRSNRFEISFLAKALSLAAKYERVDVAKALLENNPHASDLLKEAFIQLADLVDLHLNTPAAKCLARFSSKITGDIEGFIEEVFNTALLNKNREILYFLVSMSYLPKNQENTQENKIRFVKAAYRHWQQGLISSAENHDFHLFEVFANRSGIPLNLWLRCFKSTQCPKIACYILRVLKDRHINKIPNWKKALYLAAKEKDLDMMDFVHKHTEINPQDLYRIIRRLQEEDQTFTETVEGRLAMSFLKSFPEITSFKRATEEALKLRSGKLVNR